MAANPGEGGALNSWASQFLLWNVLSQLTAPLLLGVVTILQQQVNSKELLTPLDPATLADMVVRSVLDQDAATTEAGLTGLNPARFGDLVHNAGEPLPLGQLLEAFRRGIIDENGTGPNVISLEQGIRESRLKDKWADTLKQLQWQLLSPGEAVNAWVRSQISEAQARDVLAKNGIDDADATILYDSTGRPPGPAEAMEAVRRGLIPADGTGPDVLSLQQAIAEGDTKNKWYPVYKQLLEAIPPPRTVTALLRAGSITDAEALAFFQAAGLSQHVAAAYVADAHHQKTAAARELTKAELLALYKAKIMSGADVTAALAKLGYAAADAEHELALADYQAELALLNKAIGRVQSLYLAHKIDDATAAKALTELNVPAGQQGALMTDWKLERAVTVRVLTPAEIATAFFHSFLSADEALAELEALGYGGRSAWIILANRIKAPLDGVPMPAADAPPL